MKEEEASRTSDNAAALRAVHLIRHGDPKIFEDSYAMRLTSRRGQRMVGNRFLYWLFFKNDFFYGWVHPVIGEVVARARYAEEQLESAIREGVSQYVLLGAGMDSFALRRPDLADSVTVFEIDHPATQQLKKKRLSKLGIPLPKNLSFIPVDFEHESLADVLSKSSFSPNVKTFFSWLGTTMYLEKSEVLRTLEDMASCSTRGSKIVFDYIDPTPLHGTSSPRAAKRLTKTVRRRGEPMISGFYGEELFDELLKAGFEIVECLRTDEIRGRYFMDRTDGLTIAEHAHFLCAEVVREERPAVAD